MCADGICGPFCYIVLGVYAKLTVRQCIFICASYFPSLYSYIQNICGDSPGVVGTVVCVPYCQIEDLYIPANGHKFAARILDLMITPIRTFIVS